MKKKLAALLALCLTLTLTVLPAAALEAEDAKQLLAQYYVDGVPEDVMELDSLEEILEALDDPYTTYMSAEEYQKFLSAVNGETVVGIGVSVQNAFDNGFRIMSILPDSPALEAGLEAGDRIIAVDGQTLTDGMDIQSAIGGAEGTQVTITVVSQSDGQTRDYTLVRRSVEIPIVTYEQVGDAGYIDCSSFGESTPTVVGQALEELDDDVALWVMDLRSNPGGTDRSATLTAGQFVGSAIMVYFRDANDIYYYEAPPAGYGDLTDKPLVILTSPYSASGSELFAAAIRDHGAGVAVGQRTYGKGVAQVVFDAENRPDLFDGDCLKVTVYRFYSPDGVTNHEVGVLPSLLVSMEHTAAVARLLSAAEPSRASGYLKLELAGQTLYVDLAQAEQEGYQAAFDELLEAIPPAAVLYRGTGSKTWTAVEPADLARKLGLDYAGRTFTDIEDSPFAQQIETLAAYLLVGGYEDGTFQPENTVTRAEFCTMVDTAMNLPEGGGETGFSDVPEDAWYAQAVSAMADMGFIAGYGDGTFRPDATITYQEMVTVLSSVAAWASMDGRILSQQELSVEEWADYYTYAEWAQVPARNLDALGALVGGLAPTDNVTREVAAGVICSLMEGIHLIWD